MENLNRVNTRSSNFELLRIVAMLFVVALHSVYFGAQFGRMTLNWGGYLINISRHSWALSVVG